MYISHLVVEENNESVKNNFTGKHTLENSSSRAVENGKKPQHHEKNEWLFCIEILQNV